MRSGLRVLVPALMISASLLLSGCKSAEEKAEDYYQSGLTLLASGDEDRALVEFRNVFKYNGFHKEARKTYADLQLKRGEVAEAYSQYLRLIEQYPDTVEVRQALAQIALTTGDWAEVERHGKAAIALAPDAPASRAIAATLDYRTAALAKNEAGKAAALKKAQAVLTETPDNQVARRIVIDYLANGPTPQNALPEIDKALVLEPKSLEFNALKFRLLAMKNDMPATGAQLQKMFELFPDNTEVRSALIGWYLSQKDIDGAEAFLRKLAGDDTAAPEGHMAVVQLLQTARSPEAARAELDRLATANAGQPNADIYRAGSAALDFAAGKKDEAIASFEDILKTATPSDQTRRIKLMLAHSLVETQNKVGARALVEEILAEDPTHVDALKMRAGWLIADDKPGEAIVDLRAALSQNPRDADTLTLMAEAHERDGSPELAGERLAAAVEVSGSAPAESLRYARFLLRDGRTAAAETVLVDARRVNPTDVGVLSQLAGVWVSSSDWDRAQEIVSDLGKIDTPEAKQAMQTLQTTLMQGQNRTDESLTFLQNQIAEGTGGNATVALIVQTYVRGGKLGEARTYLDDALTKTPDDSGLQMLNGMVYGLEGKQDKAEQVFRSLIEKNPTAERPVQLLYGMLDAAGRADDATAVLDAGLKAMPQSGMLRWVKAGQLEKAGDIDGAITVYEALYAESSDNQVVANNLASLITAHRDDPASLERAFAIARRLRGSDVPAFQDTYGWIEYRRGNLTEALADLEPAAAGLPDDALTQYHLGMTYAGLKRTEDAKRLLTHALEMAGDSPLPQFQTARDTLAGLGAP
ncbi:MAG: tetratricopeptide repeat protein [Microgenomates group bacterium]